jgi:hypothetical protein
MLGLLHSKPGAVLAAVNDATRRASAVAFGHH